jgi:hypothetical protein
MFNTWCGRVAPMPAATRIQSAVSASRTLLQLTSHVPAWQVFSIRNVDQNKTQVTCFPWLAVRSGRNSQFLGLCIDKQEKQL